MAPDALEQFLAPGLNVAGIASLQQQQQSRAAKAAGDVLGPEHRAHQRCELREQILSGQHTHLALECAEFVRPHAGDIAHAARRRISEPLGQLLEQIAARPKSRRGIAEEV